MMRAKIIGAITGILLATWFLIARPMLANHDTCGHVTLCSVER